MKRRFIAGATCPSCQSSDSLRWWVENDIELVECVDCDYKEQRLPKAVEQSEHNGQEMIGVFKPE
ncbi:YheV family putative zinc ribbon protein [Vibrio sp. HN007]|uniref:YheV family putative zinc ribbon protein n=1 Tax=Vibrio iocasae TaxID=3098914 RepID=UPI0035D3F375